MRYRSNKTKVFVTVAADVLLFAAALLTFAWFHHVRPKKFDNPTVLATPVPISTPEPVVTPTPVPPTADPEASLTPTPEPTPSPTPEPTGLLKGKFADKFTDGEIISNENEYHSRNVCVEMSEHSTTISGLPVVYTVADIYIQDISSFRTEMAQTANHKERLEAMAKRTNAIVAASGDFWMFDEDGIVIRNGELYRDKLDPNEDICVLYYDGTMKTYLKGEIDLEAIYAAYPLHAWSFGPRLLNNGQPITDRSGFNTSNYVFDWHPRCALGYYEPGHYCFVIVDGRQQGYTHGMDMIALSNLMYELGCTEAYNLDGGLTAMMAYKGELYSHPCGDNHLGRPNCDILYIAEPTGNNGTGE